MAADRYEPVAREAVNAVDDAMAGLMRVAFMSQGDQGLATAMKSERLHRMLGAADAECKVVEMGGRDGQSQ